MAHTCFCQMLLLHMLPEQKITSSPAPSATISHTKNTTWGSTSKLMNCHPRLTNVLLAMCWSTPGSFSGNTNLYVGSTTRCKTCNVSNKLSFSAITLLGSFGRHCGRVRGADGGKQIPLSPLLLLGPRQIQYEIPPGWQAHAQLRLPLWHLPQFGAENQAGSEPAQAQVRAAYSSCPV